MNSYLEINMSAISNNIKLISKNKKPCIMLKANYYGCSKEIINHLIALGYDFFGVTTLQEAIEIREINKNCEILIVAKVADEELILALENNIILSMTCFNDIQKFENMRYHLKVDVGMNRLGFKEYELDKVNELLRKNQIKPEGIFSHLPCAINKDITNTQIEYFKKIVMNFNYKFEWIHIQNSIASMNYELDFVNMVRPGLGCLGYFANKEEKKTVGIELEESFRLYAFVEQVKNSDGYVGYDCTEYFKGTLATLRIGYHDGMSRNCSGFKFNTGNKVIGNICMCQMMIDGIEIDENYFEIFGKKNSIYALAEYQNKIVYEVLVSISQRIIRKFVF